MGRTLQIICGVVLAVGVMALRQAPDTERVPQPGLSVESQANSVRRDGGPQPAPIPVVVLKTPGQAITDEASAAESRKHNAEDLDAQVRAANAAEKQISPAWAAAFLTFAGTVLLVWNLIVARRSVAVARQHMTTDLRAWVVPGDPIVQISAGMRVAGVVHEEGLMFAVPFQNTGRTPAVQALIGIYHEIGPRTGTAPAIRVPANPFDASRVVIGPGQRGQSVWRIMVGEEMSAFLAGRSALYIVAEATYHTIFDDESRVTEICYKVVRNGTRDDGDGVPQPALDTTLMGSQIVT